MSEWTNGYARNFKFSRVQSQLNGHAPLSTERVSRTADYRDLLSPKTLEALQDYENKVNTEVNNREKNTEGK
jgi:hypothetical protein